MKRRFLIAMLPSLLMLGQAPGATAASPVTIRVIIDDTKPTNSFFTIPAHPTATKGQVVRLVVENHGAQPHTLQSNETKDVIETQPNETKVLEFTVTQVPMLFSCKIGARTEKFNIGPVK